MEEETVNRPKWLLELENRKRKPRLAHEAGAGASCMNCKLACPGLDLHFWRKICKICKCSQDDHDVDDDEFPQFDLLFGPSGKFKKKSLRMKINNNKEQTEEETTFDWIPPDTTKELAIDYMKALPAEKLPIKGSSGAALRRHLLQKQLPLHDIDHKVCNKLTEQEQKQFEKYLESIKKYVGQGKVIKMFDIRPFDCSLVTPINATDTQQCKPPQYRPCVPSAGVQLRTPSSFAIKTSYKTNIKQSYEGQNKQDATYDNKLHNEEGRNCLYTQSNSSPVNCIARSQPLEGKFYDNSQCSKNVNKKGINSKLVNTLTHTRLAEQEIVPTRTMQTSGKHISYVETSPKSTLKNALQECGEISKNTAPCIARSNASETVSIADSMLAEALLPPSAIHTSDIIASTLDEKELMFIREKLTNKYNATDNPVPHVIPQLSRPLDAKCNDILQYPCSVRAKDNDNFGNNNKEIPDKATIDSNTNLLLSKYNFSDPNIDSVSTSQYSVDPLRVELNSSVLQPTVIHSEQLKTQVFGHIVGSTEQPTILARNIQHMEYPKDGIENLKINVTKMQKCENCREDIRIGDVAVIAEKANNASWHPGCFVCSICNELLVDLVYFYYKNKLYCGRDLAAFLGIPRCFACDELIFVREYTVAEGHNYHVKHFCCWDCDMPLAGQQYITENDRPLCLPCYQQSYAKVCAACNTVIAADQQGVAIKNLNFHATEVCFCCYSCKKNLLNGRMAIKEDKLFCSKECIAKFVH